MLLLPLAHRVAHQLLAGALVLPAGEDLRLDPGAVERAAEVPRGAGEADRRQERLRPDVELRGDASDVDLLRVASERHVHDDVLRGLPRAQEERAERRGGRHPAAERLQRHQQTAGARVLHDVVDQLAELVERRGVALGAPHLPEARLGDEIRHRAVDLHRDQRAPGEGARASQQVERHDEDAQERVHQAEEHARTVTTTAPIRRGPLRGQARGRGRISRSRARRTARRGVGERSPPPARAPGARRARGSCPRTAPC